jgi:hypothetical protein
MDQASLGKRPKLAHAARPTMRVPEQILAAVIRAIGPEGAACSCGASDPSKALGWHLGLRLVCRLWARVVPPIAMKLFPRARLVVPRDVLAHCSAPFLATTIRTFGGAAQLEVEIGRKKVCYPGPVAVGAIAESPEISAVDVVCRLGRSSRTRVPLEHLSSVLARLLAAGKVASLSLGGEEDRCSINELVEIVRVLRGPAAGPELAWSLARVRKLRIAQNRVVLGQRKGVCFFGALISLLPNLESLVIDNSIGAHYAFLVVPVARLKFLTELTLDGCRLPYLDPAMLLPPTLETLSLRDVPLSPSYFRRLVTGIGALERLVSCDLACTMQGLPDDGCIQAITRLINKLRRLDISMNQFFTNDHTRDAQLAHDMLSSETLERLSIVGVCIPSHVVLALGIALPATRLARLEISTSVYGTVVPEVGVQWLREATPRSCALVLVQLPNF